MDQIVGFVSIERFNIVKILESAETPSSQYLPSYDQEQEDHENPERRHIPHHPTNEPPHKIQP